MLHMLHFITQKALKHGQFPNLMSQVYRAFLKMSGTLSPTDQTETSNEYMIPPPQCDDGEEEEDDDTRGTLV